MNTLFVACLVALILSSCDSSLKNKRHEIPLPQGVVATFNVNFKYSGSSPNPEVLLELILENKNEFGIMTKVPLFDIVDAKTNDTYGLNYFFASSDSNKIPTYTAYEDSLGSTLKNPLQYGLEKYIMDSLSKCGEKIDSLKANDIHGFTFIKPFSKSVFLLDLTIILNKANGQYKIYPYNDNISFDYNANYVPSHYLGFTKVLEDIKFDTFYLAANHK